MKFSFGVLLQALLFIPLVGTRLPAQDSPVILRDRPIAPRFTESQVEAGTGLPTWHHRFTFKGTSYPYTMVGTDPAKGSETTIIPVYIIPLKFTFTDGEVFDSTAKMFDKEISATEAVIESPVFQSAPFHAGSVDVGTTQYVDAFQRANFWSRYPSTPVTTYCWEIRRSCRCSHSRCRKITDSRSKVRWTGAGGPSLHRALSTTR